MVCRDGVRQHGCQKFARQNLGKAGAPRPLDERELFLPSLRDSPLDCMQAPALKRRATFMASLRDALCAYCSAAVPACVSPCNCAPVEVSRCDTLAGRTRRSHRAGFTVLPSGRGVLGRRAFFSEPNARRIPALAARAPYWWEATCLSLRFSRSNAVVNYGLGLA